jgi:hypothetical protein
MSASSKALLNAVLIELSISSWTARKLDKGASREVKASNNAASDDAARVNKNLLAGMDNLKKINDFVAIKRSEYYQMTLPWSDLGQRMLPMAGYFPFLDWKREAEDTFNRMVAEFITEYPTLISAQAFQLGALFNRAEYPSAEEIRSKFSFSVHLSPIPERGDFRVDAPQELIEALSKEYAEKAEERVRSAQDDLWRRLYETLRHLSDRLGYDEQGKKKVFRDSLVDNAVELCSILKTLNITQDPELDRARQELESMMLGVDADEIRKDGARDEIKAKVDSALSAWF